MIALVEEDFLNEIEQTPVRIRREAFRSGTLISHLRRGEAPIVLISLFRLHGEKGPHWVCVVGYDSHVFRIGILDFIPAATQLGIVRVGEDREEPGFQIAVRPELAVVQSSLQEHILHEIIGPDQIATERALERTRRG